MIPTSGGLLDESQFLWRWCYQRVSSGHLSSTTDNLCQKFVLRVLYNGSLVTRHTTSWHHSEFLHSEAFTSACFVVQAVNSLKEDFDVDYPANHIKQREIANSFLEISAAFGCCAGAIDGILIWIHKPSDKDCALSGCNSGKFYCGRKHKFGLNCRAAVCDASCGRILNMAIQYPGYTSDSTSKSADPMSWCL